jgi:hypothetical protein
MEPIVGANLIYFHQPSRAPTIAPKLTPQATGSSCSHVKLARRPSLKAVKNRVIVPNSTKTPYEKMGSEPR